MPSCFRNAHRSYRIEPLAMRQGEKGRRDRSASHRSQVGLPSVAGLCPLRVKDKLAHFPSISVTTGLPERRCDNDWVHLLYFTLVSAERLKSSAFFGLKPDTLKM
jgi:hypothetical protein